MHDNLPPGITEFDIDSRMGPGPDEIIEIEEPFDADDDSGDYDPDLGDDGRNLPNVDPEELEAITQQD